MIALTLAIALQAVPAPPPPSGERDELLIYYAPGSATIDARYRPVIDDALRQIAKYKPTRIVIHGHTDTVGTVEDNEMLSMLRAGRVMSMLSDSGLAGERLGVHVHGETALAVATADDVAEPLNNRVVIVLENPTIPAR